MADNELENLELLKKKSITEGINSKRVFKCCKTKQVSVVVCLVCGSSFHKSCIARKSFKAVDDSRIVCCDSENNLSEANSVQDDSNPDEVNSKTENFYLKQLISEFNQKFAILYGNKRLLDDKVDYLSETNRKLLTELQQAKNHQQNIPYSCIVGPPNKKMQAYNLTSKQDSGVSTMKEDPKIKSTGGLEKSKITEKSHDSNEPNTLNYQMLKDKQKTVLKSLININEDQLTKLPEPPHPNDEIAFKTVSYKRNRKVQFGQAEISEYDEINGFVGRDRENKKVWLFISRVKDHVLQRTT
ncbi:hypothetical protein JTB14_017598 [Gonioctena quinquepunctata]|nr:hypothetical protein JTB14_017598 [Gonioctena quinquepunctata]